MFLLCLWKQITFILPLMPRHLPFWMYFTVTIIKYTAKYNADNMTLFINIDIQPDIKYNLLPILSLGV